ncbi:MAG: hypothetical protein IKE01_00775 [Clostridia bacterium]|nr:hypothetical protein [Clostridia bacterium]
MKKAVIIIVSVLVLAVGTCACLYFFTDVFNFLKPTSDNFSLQAKKLFGAKEALSYSDYIKSIESLKMKDESYTSNGNISLNVSLPDSMVDYSTQRMINNTSINWIGSYNKDTKTKSNKLGLLYNNKELINLNTLKKGSKLTVQSSDLYDKPLSLDFDKLEEFNKNNNLGLDKASIDSIKSSMTESDNTKYANMLYDLFYLTEDEYNSLGKNYGKIFSELIEKDNYSSKKNQKIVVGGDEIKTTAYSLTISGKDVHNYMLKLTNTAKDDSSLKDILIKKYNVLKKYIDTITSNPTYTVDSALDIDDLPERISNSDIEEFFDDFIEELEDSEDLFEEIGSSLKFTIYSNKKHNPVKFTVAFVKDKEDDGTVFFTQDVEDEKNTYTINVQAISDTLFTPSYEEDSYLYSTSSRSELIAQRETLSTITIIDKYEKNDNSRKGTMSVTANISDEKRDLFTIDYDFVFSDTEIKNNIKITSPDYNSLSLNLEFNVTGLKEDTQKYVFNLSGKVPIMYSTYKIDLKTNESITYGKSDIQEPTDIEDVFAKSGADLQAVIDKVFENASNNLPSKLSNYGIKITKEDILALK